MGDTVQPVPTVYIDFPPSALSTFGVVIFVLLFHYMCSQITKVIYLN